MLLQASFTENQLFFNPDSFLTQAITDRTCPQGQNNPLNQVYTAIGSVFFF